MKIATWNVNSLRVRLPHVTQWLSEYQADVLCLQETKSKDENFPADEIEALGYQVIYSGQKTYNGVATLSKTQSVDIVTDFPGFDDPARRVLGTTIGSTRILNLYVPNGQSVDSEKYQYKLEWLSHLHRYVKSQLKEYEKLVIVGDFNIAPEDQDVHDPEQWRDKILCSDKERQALKDLLSLGLHDTFRKFDQEEKLFSWWDYRAAAFRRNLGLRIDLILCSTSIFESVSSCIIDKAPRKLERPSDHTPVVAEFEGI